MRSLNCFTSASLLGCSEIRLVHMGSAKTLISIDIVGVQGFAQQNPSDLQLPHPVAVSCIRIYCKRRPRRRINRRGVRIVCYVHVAWCRFARKTVGVGSRRLQQKRCCNGLRGIADRHPGRTVMNRPCNGCVVCLLKFAREPLS
jgi:hypothetical protein